MTQLADDIRKQGYLVEIIYGREYVLVPIEEFEKEGET